MTRQEIYNMIVRAKRPIDLFKEVTSIKELKKKYTELAKKIHPDTAKANEQYISSQGFMLLHTLYEQGQKELEDGIYDVTELSQLYKSQTPLFDLNVKGKVYKFYENIYNGEISDIYKGLCDDDVICLKVALDETDNDLLKKEYETLMKYSHTSMPIARDYLKINGLSAILMDEMKGENLESIMERHPNGLHPQHIMWIMERLFSVIGYLHSNFIIHENIIPENIIINTQNHNVAIMGFSFHISDANKDDKHYMIANDKFAAPEVNKTTRVLPQSDIYSLGKLAIYMLGGSTITNGMPMSVPSEIRTFIRKMVKTDVNKRPNDAWKLWDEWRNIRTKLYGNDRFQKADF